MNRENADKTWRTLAESDQHILNGQSHSAFTCPLRHTLTGNSKTHLRSMVATGLLVFCNFLKFTENLHIINKSNVDITYRCLSVCRVFFL